MLFFVSDTRRIADWSKLVKSKSVVKNVKWLRNHGHLRNRYPIIHDGIHKIYGVMTLIFLGLTYPWVAFLTAVVLSLRSHCIGHKL